MIDSTGRDAYSCEMNEVKCPQKTTDLGADRPVCECHDKPMTKAGTQRSGRQRWLCTIVQAARNARPEAKAARAAYEASDKGKATQARYAASLAASFEGWFKKMQRNARRYANPELRDQAAAELAAVQDEIRETEAALAALTTEVA